VAALAPPLRLATEADAPVLAELIEAASRGIASYAWSLMAEPGEDPWTVGVQRQAARAREGSWIVVDEGTGAVAALRAVPPDEAGAPDPAMPPVFRPLIELEALLPDALHVNVLAVLPAMRGHGLGTLLLRHAEAMARAEGRPCLSLIVADENVGARRLYRRVGYREAASRSMVMNGWTGIGETWLLLAKDVETA
jgi:ribosomal protein S18 acetylase RimI-like enzyme